MHRDISSGNILIYQDENGVYSGLLADWDLCKLISDDKWRTTHRTVFRSMLLILYVIDAILGNMAVHVGGSANESRWTSRADRRP
jgi:serine/threonine protein kinase